MNPFESDPIHPGMELTHYTTLYGFKEIIRNKKIFASNPIFLNDHREINHGLEFLRKNWLTIVGRKEVGNIHT